LPIIFHNTSDHAIDTKQLKHNLNIYTGQNVIFTSDEVTSDHLNWGERFMIKGSKETLTLNLPKDLTNHLLENIHTDNYTLEFITRSKKDGQLVGQLKQSLQIKIGPIAGESTVDISISDNINLKYDNTKSEYKAVFALSVKNTSDHIININQA